MSFGPAGPGPPRGAAPERVTVSSPLSTQLFLAGSSQQRGPKAGALTSRRLLVSLATRVLRGGPTYQPAPNCSCVSSLSRNRTGWVLP